jgi:hypothetical protein
MLREPAKIVSLAESWSTLEIPQFGTLIWDGPAEATLTIWADGLVEIHLSQGKVGLQGLAAGAQVRFETSGANWTARSLEGGSTFAVIDDPLSPAMLFVKGAIGVENLTFGPKQIVRWQEGVPEPLASSSGATDSLPAPVPALGNPWDLAWLQPPDDVRSKRWRGLYGRQVDKLVIGVAAVHAEVVGAPAPPVDRYRPGFVISVNDRVGRSYGRHYAGLELQELVGVPRIERKLTDRSVVDDCTQLGARRIYKRGFRSDFHHFLGLPDL